MLNFQNTLLIFFGVVWWGFFPGVAFQVIAGFDTLNEKTLLYLWNAVAELMLSKTWMVVF